MGHWLRLRRVDPSGGRLVGWVRSLVHEAGAVLPERSVERVLARRVNGIGLAEVHLVGCHRANAAVVVFLVVPIEEASAECSGILNAPEVFGEPWLVFQGFEAGLRVGVVVGCVRAAMRLDDPEIAEEQSGRFGFHRSAAIGMQRELAGRDVVLGDGFVEQRLEQGGCFGLGDLPADNAAAVDIEDDIEYSSRSTWPVLSVW